MAGGTAVGATHAMAGSRIMESANPHLVSTLLSSWLGSWSLPCHRCGGRSGDSFTHTVDTGQPRLRRCEMQTRLLRQLAVLLLLP